MNIMWGITGAGCFLRESFEAVEESKRNFNVKVTIALTRAGEELVRIYGLEDRLKNISPGRYYEEVLTEGTEGRSGYRIGRLAAGLYDALFVSPATANTVAKIVMGIADTLVTNAVAQAVKGGVPVLIVPTDQKELIETPLPHRVDREACVGCSPCPAVEACPYGALKMVAGKAWIDLATCHGCGACVEACPYSAVKGGERVMVRVRRVDLENVERLKRMEGISVLSSPSELSSMLRRLEG